MGHDVMSLYTWWMEVHRTKRRESLHSLPDDGLRNIATNKSVYESLYDKAAARLRSEFTGLMESAVLNKI